MAPTNLCILSTCLLILIIASGMERAQSARDFTIINSCKETVWPASITTGNSLSRGGPGGIVLEPGESAIFPIPDDWSGRIWGRTGCDFNRTGNDSCQTGNCGSSLKNCSASAELPVTLAEFTLGQGSDYYDVSLVDGFNLPLVVTPINSIGNETCTIAGCDGDLTPNCPSELVFNSTTEGKIVGCRSPCQVFRSDPYCCTGNYSNPGTCQPTVYSYKFKEVCPAAYSYAYDDRMSSFTCSRTDFVITFCSSRLKQNTLANSCEGCLNSGGRCSYNQSSRNFICSRGGASISNRTTTPQYLPNATTTTRSFPNATITPPANPTTTGGLSLRSKIIIGVSTGVGVVGVLTVMLVFFLCQKHKRRGTATPNVELFLENYGCLSLKRYKYRDIKKITCTFKDKLGQGGYGSVYKGKLVDGRLVAVKVLVDDPKKSNGEDFINEVCTIGKTNHVNVVTLLGFCSSGSKRALVYEFMPNGSLEKFIYSKKESATDAITTVDENLTLGWEKLCQIAIGIARGLEYLHRGCSTGRILHFDIKPHNVLLDENFCPKISDFGLAKLCPTRESIISMPGGGRGTVGYIAPEVYCRNFGGVSSKSDVYSYGMMVLEMVGGRKNIDPFVDNSSEIYFPHWIHDRLQQRDNRNEGWLRSEKYFEDEMARKMIMVGLWCVQTNPTDRPSMGKVAEMLEGKIEDLQMPPKPIVASSSTPTS